MRDESLCLEFDYGTCVSSTWDGGSLKVGVDHLGEQGSGRPLLPLQPLGLYARPLDPTMVGGRVMKGAGALYGYQGDDGFVMPTTDPRLIDLIPKIGKGGTVLYGAGPFMTMGGEDVLGSVMVLVPYKKVNGSNTKSMVLSFDVSTDGTENIQLTHGEGHGLKLLGDSNKSILLGSANGQATLMIDNNGINLIGKTKVVGGGLVVGNAPAAQPVMLAPDLMAWIAQVNVALAAAAAGSGLPTNPTIVAPVAVPKFSSLLSASELPS